MIGIEEAIEDALSHQDDPPPNEASTCEWVILPLLWSGGYAKRDILSHAMDGGGEIPDYTILPKDEDQKFFLEAKAWKVSLEDEHARQALNYANGEGKQWVILTNGQEWRLYDNYRRGQAPDKNICKVRLEKKEEAVLFFKAIGKDSVLSGGLKVYAEAQLRLREELERKKAEEDRRIRIHEALCKVFGEQQSPESELVRAICTILAKDGTLRDLKAEDIVRYFSVHNDLSVGEDGSAEGGEKTIEQERVLPPGRDGEIKVTFPNGQVRTYRDERGAATQLYVDAVEAMGIDKVKKLNKYPEYAIDLA